MSHFDPAWRNLSSRAPVRFETLDAWRGICALMVAMLHFPVSGPLGENLLVRNGFLFVDYFFVLSGFVIAYGYGDRLSTGVDYARFAVTRIGRIYPLHVAVLAVFVAWETARLLVPALRGSGPAPFTEGNTLAELWSTLALLNGMGLEERLTWNGPSWSISAEFWTYFVFGAIVLALGRRYWIALVPVIVAAPVALYHWSPLYIDATWNHGFIRCLYGFSLGALIFVFAGPWLTSSRREGGGNRGVWTALELLLLGAVASFVALAGREAASLAAPFVFGAALIVFAREGGAVSRIMRQPVFLWLGALSYGVYMVHIFVQGRLINAATIAEKISGMDLVGDFSIGAENFYGFGVQGPVFGTIAMVVMIVAVVGTAWVAHILVERPFQRLSRRWAAQIGEKRAASRGLTPRSA